MRLTTKKNMGLKEYIDETRTRVYEIAEMANVTTATVHNLINGRDVRASVLFRIQDATLGKVRAEKMYRDLIEAKRNKNTGE